MMAQQTNPAPATSVAPSPVGEYFLNVYGPVATAAQAQATLQKALADIVAKGGGVLVVPAGVAADWKFENTSPSSTLFGASTVTIIDRRGGYERVLVPSNGLLTPGNYWASRSIERDVRQPIDRVFGVHSTQVFNTNIAGGTASFNLPTLFATEKGADRRIYPVTVRGLFAGMHINFTGQPRGYGGQNETIVLKSVGWDKEKRLPFVVADLQFAHPADALLSNKHVVNSVSVLENSNSDNQSMALLVKRQNYGQGDSFGIHSLMRSQGNVMSAAGDEGGLTFSADIDNDLNPFHSRVETVNWNASNLVYAPGAVNNHTLGTSRPLINLNPAKALRTGTVQIVAPGHEDPWDPQDAHKTGKTFQKQVFAGGAIIGSRDCRWTPEVVGRFFAVDEPAEYLDPANDPAAGYTNPPQRRLHRWYLIQKLENRADGTQRLFVERTRWWSNSDQAPQLYVFDNYTWSGHERPLKYVIAPGAYVADVSRAWTNAEASGGLVEASSPRTLRLAPNGDVGTRFDFAPGDEITQAIGQDPWNPTGMRVRHHNYLPTTIDDASYQSVNVGRVTVHSGLNVAGGDGDLKSDLQSSKDKRPRFLRGVDVQATTGIGLHFRGDVNDAAIQFQQPHNRAQPLKWVVNNFPTHSLTVDPQAGGFAFRGNGILLPQGGISGGEKTANNLRGIGVAVAVNTQKMTVTFERPEPDANYAINVQPNWLTQDAVTEKTPQGFTVTFSSAPAQAGRLDWMLLR